MLRSMTGFGGASTDVDGIRYAVEIRSVNNKYLKVQMRLPEELTALEADVESLSRALRDMSASAEPGGVAAAKAFALLSLEPASPGRPWVPAGFEFVCFSPPLVVFNSYRAFWNRRRRSNGGVR